MCSSQESYYLQVYNTMSTHVYTLRTTARLHFVRIKPFPGNTTGNTDIVKSKTMYTVIRCISRSSCGYLSF